jgi:hypothetical protein
MADQSKPPPNGKPKSAIIQPAPRPGAKPTGGAVKAPATGQAAKPAVRPSAPQQKPATPEKKPGPGPSKPAPPPAEAGPFDRQMIYFVECAQDPTALIARRAGIDDGWLHWDDTNRDRMHRVLHVENEGETIRVYAERGFLYLFRPLTIELYNDKVREHVELSPMFGSTEELQDFYRNAAM